VLDPAEQATISTHIRALNDVIRTTVAAHGMALADTYAIYEFLSQGPFDFFGRTLTTRFGGGLFSLDGVHPSTTGQALSAFFFIEALNQHYGLGIPQIDATTFQILVLTDPHIDHDGDGRVTGRFGAGLLETLMLILNISGDSGETAGSLAAAPETATKLAPRERSRAMRKLFGIAP
jgi:hypothetical protein